MPDQPDPIEEYLRHRRNIGRLNADSAEHYRYVLSRMDRELPEGVLCSTHQELEAWICRPEFGRATRANFVTIVRGFTKWAVANRWIDRDEGALLPTISAPRGRPKPMPEQALADILRRAEMPYVLAIELAAYMGMRCVEIARLDRQDVTEGAARVWGKGDKWRDVPTHPIVWRRVKSMPDGPLVRCTQTGRRLTRKQVSSRIRTHLKTLGYGGYHAHMGRHRFGTQAYESSGHDIAAVQDLLGHANITTTRRYIAVDSGRLASAVNALPVAG